MLLPHLREEDFWSEAWTRHLENYLAAEPRCGRWLSSRFGLHGWSVLECAGGSCRDSRFLYQSGVSASGSDFDRRTIEYLRARFPHSQFNLFHEDASALSFEDRSFDLVFHNGFWVLFDDDSKIRRLLTEQLRVTRHIAIAVVHNSLNHQLVERFRQLGRTDPLYQIRFFCPDELNQLVQGSSDRIRRVTIEPFGGLPDRLYGYANRMPTVASAIRATVPKLYRLQPWSSVERLALVIELGEPCP